MLICHTLQDEDAKALKDSYAKAQQVAQAKAAEFDKVRDAARALNKELNDKSRLLKEQEAEVARLAVRVPLSQCLGQNSPIRMTLIRKLLTFEYQFLMPKPWKATCLMPQC